MVPLDLTLTLHAIAGLGAAGLGLGALLRAPSRGRNRDFAWLCLAIALWNLGSVGQRISGDPTGRTFRALYLAGSCAAAPLALRFVLGLCGAGRRRRRAWTVLAGLAAATLWLASGTRLYGDRTLWAVAAIVVLGGSLVAALVVLAHHLRRTPAGPERRALALILAGGIIGVAGGLTDFVPRAGVRITEIGPIAVVVFLLIVSAVVVRHRFLDVDVYLARAVSLIAGAAAVGLAYLGVLRFVDPSGRFSTLFLTSALVLAVAVPLGRAMVTRARSLLSPADPVTLALQRASRRLAGARSAAEVWEILEQARAALPADVEVEVYFRGRDQARFRLVFGSATATAERAPVDAADAVPTLLERERLPVTRRFLESESRESPARRSGVEKALQQLRHDDRHLLVPVFEDRGLAGWIAVGGGHSGLYTTAEVATAFLAVGHQALASLERVEAWETARRQEALAAVGELAAGLAHEVRNPVAAIRGAAQAMGPEATAAERDEMREVIEQESDRLGRFVGEFLDYARPAPPRREDVDPAALFAQGLRGQELAGRRIEARVSIVEPAPHVAGDPDQLRRVLDNLLRNAWEAAGDGVRVRLEVRAAGDGRVAVRIEDNGPGIPTEELPRVFQPFHTTREGGTGLGLALVHRIVEAHGGEVRVDSSPGSGAAFTLMLPKSGGARGTENRG